MKRVCGHCGTEVVEEREEGLREEYPYYCPECDENMYSFETEEIGGQDEKEAPLLCKSGVQKKDTLAMKLQ